MSNENKRKYIVEFDVNKASLNQLKSTIQEIQKMSVGDFKAASPQGFNSFEEARTELQRIKKLTAEVDKALEDAFNPQMGVPNLTKLTDSIKKIGVDNIARSWDQLGAVGGSATRQLATGLIATNTQLKQSHKLLDDMATSFKNTVKWGISSTAFNTMTNSLSSAWGYAKNLNKVLTDIRIVSDQSASDMERFAKQAAKAAKELGATTLDYGNAALLYYQQGDSAEQVAEKANLTVKMANVLGASASEVSNYMTAIWNNFDDGSRSLEYYADVLTKLGAATASSAEEISDGLEKFAAVANTVDLSYEYATAALTTITATTRQSADVVGTALKTLFARIQDLELGETLDDGTTLGKYSEALEKVGISLKGQDGQLRSMDDLLDDMGSKWQGLTKNQKVALAQTVAGTRQYTQLVALMDNWDVMQQNIKLAQEATGSLQEQQDEYMESTAAHLNKLTASAERFMDALIDDNVINGLIDSLTTVTDLLGSFVEGVGGGTNALFMLGSIGADVFSKQITNSLLITIQNLKTAARAAQETRTSFENVGAMDVLWEGEDNTVQRLKQDLLSVESEMDKDDIKAVNEQLQQLGAETDKLIRANKAVEDAVAQYKQFGGTGPDDAHSEFDLRDTEQFGEIFNTVSADTKKLETDMKNLDEAYSKLIQDKDMSALTDFINKFETGKKDMQEFGEAYKNVFNEGELQEIEDATIQMEKFISNLQQIQDDKNFSDDERSDAILDALSNDTKSHRGYISSNTQGIEAVGKKATNVLNTLGAQGEANYNKVVEASGDARKKILRDLDDVFNRFKDAKEVRAFVKTLSGVGETVTSVLALANLGEIFNDDDLSGWEKFAQLTLTISVAIPTLINGISDVVDGFKTLGDFAVGIWKGVSETVNATKTVAANKVVEESTENVTKEYKELNKTISVDNAAATNAKLIEDQKQIASNNAVIVSIKARKAAEKDGAGEKLVEGVSGAVAEKVGKEVGKEIVQEGIEKGVAGAASSGVWATLKGKVAGILGGGASGASGIGTLGAMLGKIATVALPAAAAIGLVAGAVALVTHEQRQAEKQAKKLAEAVEKTEQAYNEASSAYKNFKSEMSAFTEAEKSLQQLTSGTQEWRDALVEVNQQALQMLETYPELIAYMDTSKGYMTFSEEGFKAVSENMIARSAVMQQAYMQARADQIEFEIQQTEKKAADAIVNFRKLQLDYRNRDFNIEEDYQTVLDKRSSTPLQQQRGNAPILDDSAKRIVLNALKDNQNLLYDENATDKIIELLKKNNIDLSSYTRQSQEAFVADLRSNSGELQEYTKSIDRYTSQLEAYTEQLIALQEKPKGTTDYDYNAAARKEFDLIKTSKQTTYKTDYKINTSGKQWEIDGKDSSENKQLMDKLMKEYGEKILGHDPNQPGNYYYGRDGDGKFKIGNSKDNAETVTVEDAIKRLAEYEATKEWQKEETQNKIKEDSIKNTHNAQEWTTTYLLNQNKKLTDMLNDPNNPLGVTGLPTYKNGIWEFNFTDKKNKEIQQKVNEKDADEKALNQIWAYNKDNKDAFWAAVETNGIDIDKWGGKDKVAFNDDGVKITTDVPSMVLTQDFKKWLKDNDMTESFAFDVDPETNQVIFPTDPNTIKQIQGGTATEFTKWLDDVYNERDISALYSQTDNDIYYQMLEKYKKYIDETQGEGTWDKYYNKTVKNKLTFDQFLGTQGEDGKFTSGQMGASHNMSETDRIKKEKAETDRIYQEDINNSAEALGVSREAFAAYADQIQEDNKQLKAYGRTQREINELTIEAAKNHFEFSKKLDAVNAAVKDNDDLLKKWGKSGIHDLNELDPNDAKKIGEVVEAVQGMFGEEVDTDWVQENIEDIIKLANGDMSVYDGLQDKFMDLKVAKMTIDPEWDETSKQQFQNEFNQYLDDLPDDLEIGARIEFDENGKNQFLQDLGVLVDQGKIKASEVDEMFKAKGYKVTWVPQQVPQNNFASLLKSWGLPIPDSLTTKTIQVPRLEPLGPNETSYTPNVPSTSGGGGSSSKPRQVEKIKADPDIYHDVDVELEKIGNRLEKIQNLTDRHTGANWIENLNQQFETLNDQIAMTNEKIKIAEGEAADLRGKLEANGVTFTEDGTIANYFAAYEANLNKINSVIEHYNNLKTTEAQDKYQETYDKAQEEWEKFLEDIERYDEVTTSLIPDLQQQNQEALDKQTELKIDAFKAEIEVRMDVAQAQRDWNQFKAKIIDGIEEDDILGNARAKLLDFSTYYNDEATGTIQRLTDYVADSLEQLKQFENGENMSIYDKFASNQLEDMRQFMDDLQAEMESLYELTEEIRASYLDMMDEAQEKFDEQLETYEQITSLIEHDMNLIRMVYGDDAYSELIDYYNQMHENNLETLDMHKQQVEFWANQMSILEEGSDEWQKAKENWTSAVNGLTSATEASITTIEERFTNAIENIFKTLNNEVTNGKGLDYMSKEWDLINQNADRYLDNMDSIYAIQKLQNKYQEAIDTNDGIKAQRELKTIMDAELKALREKDKLTQYDVDRAELRYQIALKQIALEEAQQNKSKMRLRRDSQGNYTYQYTADEEQVSKLQGEMSDLYQQLYDLDANEYKNNLDQLQSVWIAFQEDMKAAEQINDEEAKQARKLLLTEQYGKLINDIVAHDETVKQNLYESTMSGLLDLYNSNELNYENMTSNQQAMLDQFLNDQEALTTGAYNNLFQLYDDSILKFKNMTDSQKSLLVSDMLPTWNTTLAEMMNTIAGNGGFEETCAGAFAQLELANEEYKTGLQQLQEKSGVVFTEIKNGYDKNTEAAKNLLKENNALITSYTNQLNEVKKVIEEMEALIKKYKEAETAAKNMGIAAEEAWKKARDKDADEKQDPTIGDDRKEDEKPTLPTPTETKPAEPEKPSLSIGSYVTVKPGTKWYADSSGGGSWGYAKSGKISYTSSGPYGYNIGGGGWIRKTDIVGYNTGGYTGDWNGADGKLAMLHQKELVLNAEDTKNMLNAIQIVRTITDNLGATLLNKMNAIASNMGGNIFAGNDTLEQVVHIDAQFPNVTNSSEIEDALNNLVNRAAQHITKN